MSQSFNYIQLDRQKIGAYKAWCNFLYIWVGTNMVPSWQNATAVTRCFQQSSRPIEAQWSHTIMCSLLNEKETRDRWKWNHITEQAHNHTLIFLHRDSVLSCFNPLSVSWRKIPFTMFGWWQSSNVDFRNSELMR